MSACTGCGTVTDDFDGPGCFQCSNCPPTTCEDCGGINHPATDRMCRCWVSIADLPLADIKAIFAADGTFNIGADGSVSVAESNDSQEDR